MRPADILDLLESDPQLRQFIVAFHSRLALDNPNRDVAKSRTDNERAMDAMGRLLVGDEVCAAIAADGDHIFIASNTANHSRAQARMYLQELIFRVNEDGSRVYAQENILCEFSNKNGELIFNQKKQVDMPEYRYDRTHHKFIPDTYDAPIIEIPYEEHGIEEYPFPIKGSFGKLKDYILKPTIKVSPNCTTNISCLSPQTPKGKPLVMRLDPLFRRSSTLFSHLGMICLHSIEKEQNRDRIELFQKSLLRNRQLIMKQSLEWEVLEWYKLKKAVQRYVDTGLKKKEKEDYYAKLDKNTQLEAFIKNLTEHFNKYLNQQDTPNFLQMISDWKNLVIQNISNFDVPDFIQNSKQYPVLKFLELFATYLYELIYLEKYVEVCSRNAPDKFTETLIKIAKKETSGNDNTQCGIEIIDENLSGGTHAEARLFHKFFVKEGRLAISTPYFGITKLCCALCNTLFKSHGLNYIQGSKHRAGTSATHFSDWIFEGSLRDDKILKPFFGNAFSLYETLNGELPFEGINKTRKELACMIIQDLASLWYKADKTTLERIKRLGFVHGEILDKAQPQQSLIEQKISNIEFKEVLKKHYGLTVESIKPDGNCQFRAVARALSYLVPSSLNINSSNSSFMLFKHRPTEIEVTSYLRMETLKHIENNSDNYQEFLANSLGEDADLNQDLSFADLTSYLNHMREDGAYGDNLTLRAMAQLQERPIIVLRPGTGVDPVQVTIIPFEENIAINIDEAIIVVFNGIDHYEVVKHSSQDILSDNFYELISSKTHDFVLIQNQPVNSN